MLYATIAAAPVFGAKLVSVDTAPAEALPGVKKVVKLDNAVAVVADGYWRALKGVRALAPKFAQTGNDQVTSDTIYAAIGASIDDVEHHQEVFTSGKGSEALQGAAKVVEAEYRVPFLAHATMEPMNATVRIADGRCEVWTGVQDPLGARKTAAEASGLKPEQVTIHNQQLGGGFGRRLPGMMDFIEQAVRIAKETVARAGEVDLEPRRRHSARFLSTRRRRSLQGRACGQRRAAGVGLEVQRQGRRGVIAVCHRASGHPLGADAAARADRRVALGCTHAARVLHRIVRR